MNPTASTAKYGSNQSTHAESNPDASGLRPSEDFVDYLKAYAKAKPEAAALWCVGVGFVLGWKLKPW